MQLGSVQDTDANWTRNLQVLKNPCKGRTILLGMQVKAQGHRLGWWGWEKKSHLQLSSHGHVISRSEIQIQGKPMQSNRDLPTEATQASGMEHCFKLLESWEFMRQSLKWFTLPPVSNTPLCKSELKFSLALWPTMGSVSASTLPHDFALPFTYPISIHVPQPEITSPLHPCPLPTHLPSRSAVTFCHDYTLAQMLPRKHSLSSAVSLQCPNQNETR